MTMKSNKPIKRMGRSLPTTTQSRRAQNIAISKALLRPSVIDKILAVNDLAIAEQESDTSVNYCEIRSADDVDSISSLSDSEKESIKLAIRAAWDEESVWIRSDNELLIHYRNDPEET